jgi:hypothetical protein
MRNRPFHRPTITSTTTINGALAAMAVGVLFGFVISVFACLAMALVLQHP